MPTRKSLKAFSATITIGRHRHYSGVVIPESEYVSFIQTYQQELILRKKIYLSVAVSGCSIVLNQQHEPHLRLSFINYPKFPLDEAVLKNEIEAMARALLEEFSQNRVVIQFDDETLMLERSDETDPGIGI